MKHKDFYLYQSSEILLNTAIKTVGILFAWLMLTAFNMPQSLGIFISISWACQVIALLLFSWIYQQSNIKIDSKQLLMLFGVLCAVFFLFVIFWQDYWVFGAVFIVTSICSIVLNPLGTSLTNELYQAVDKSHAFKIRGFVNSINIILSPAISGFVIYYFKTNAIMFACIILSLISIGLFKAIKIPNANPNNQVSHYNNCLKILLLNPIERVMVVISAVCNFVITPIIAYVIPYKISHEFQLSAFYVGISESLFGIGMIIGSLFIIRFLNNKVGRYYSLIISILLVAFGILLFVVQSFYIFCFSLMMMGVGVVMFNINSTHIRCTATPSHIRQSFEFVFLSFCIAFIPIGVWLTTWMLDKGYLHYFYALSAMVVVLLALVAFYSKHIKMVHRLDDKKLTDYYSRHYASLYHA